MYGVKMREEAHVWLPAVVKWSNWSILIILHVINSQKVLDVMPNTVFLLLSPR
jgi:hypothetical protein